jgi:hypothetical protein
MPSTNPAQTNPPLNSAIQSATTADKSCMRMSYLVCYDICDEKRLRSMSAMPSSDQIQRRAGANTAFGRGSRPPEEGFGRLSRSSRSRG